MYARMRSEMAAWPQVQGGCNRTAHPRRWSRPGRLYAATGSGMAAPQADEPATGPAAYRAARVGFVRADAVAQARPAVGPADHLAAGEAAPVVVHADQRGGRNSQGGVHASKPGHKF